MTYFAEVKNTDVGGRRVLNTVFGEQTVGQKMSSLAFQFRYGLRDSDISETSANGGSYTVANSMLTLSTSTNTAGSQEIETTKYIRYLPGFQSYCEFTSVFDTAVVNSYQRCGLFDDNNGFWIGYEGTTFYVARRKDGSDTKTEITLSNVFSGYDPTKGNVYRIVYGYLGFANVYFEVLSPQGEWKVIHKIEYPNSSTSTHISDTYLPFRTEIGNTGNNTDLNISHGSISAGIVDGGGEYPTNRAYSYNLGTTAITSGTTALVAFRNKTTYNSVTNKIGARLLYISSSTDLNKVSSFDILDNPTYTGGTRSDAATDSILEVNTTGTLGAGPYDYFLNWSLGKTDSLTKNVKDFQLLLQPGGVAVFIIDTTGAGDIELSIRRDELF